MESRWILPGAGAALLLAGTLTAAAAAPPGDPLAAEIARWSAFLRNAAPGDTLVGELRPGAEPALAAAGDALRHGRRLLALQLLADVRGDLAAAGYAASHRQDPAGFEAEWTRVGESLRAELGPPAPSAFDGLQPGAVRALAEASWPQTRIYYDASLDYGRSTLPEYGLFYLGRAQATRELAGLLRDASVPGRAPAPPLRPLGPELEALTRELLAAYRPPASIDRHPAFIAASSALKEARELDAAGLRWGALLRYLQAAQRMAALRPGAAPDRAATLSRLAESERQMGTAALDHSLGRLFVERARADLEADGEGGVQRAQAIATDVLPRYLAALAPAAPSAPRPSPRLTVTLVRWPYT